MTGRPENDRCYFCGGKLESKLATLPFVANGSVVIIKNVPAQVCTQCGEAIMDSPIARYVDWLVKQTRDLKSEVSVIAYSEPLAHAA